ncbi:Gfo/Idh/MocA family oxidoreductase [Paeniglutamicibacter sp. ABSL32-1]|uniref:Gfo/Idh/MocA family protein n=1 Tax=Paeniglutamicibacter quisquiliarum TaxID=2849498 RepID=UPI001C2DAE30|nr:Gfo/Idh/MocA family oxidoreductase [Paeniglutamicibacter quisquiliarum]MBV1779688.1 Gfo/Idh/MocA family oxidoreductase [Paeniglutamicibacter quisquiliarum]
MSRTGSALGVAVIGHSFMGKAHSQAWRNVNAVFDTPKVALRVLVGRNAASVDESARRYGWEKSSTDWRASILRDDVDIVDICTPGALHAQIALFALEHGKHVLVEKPLANTLAEAQAMAGAAATAAASGVVSMLGFNYRRVPALALARELVASGRLGELRQLNIRYYQDWLVDEASPMSWRLRREEAGSGALGDLGSHAVDQVHFLTGARVSSLSATSRTFVTRRPGAAGDEDVTVDDAIWSTLELDNGAVATVEATRMATGRKNSLRIEAYGSRGSLAFDLESLNHLQLCEAGAPAGEQGFRTILVTEPQHPYLEGWWPTGHVLGWADTFIHEVRDLLLAIEGRTPASPSFADGLEVQRVLAAIESSAAAGSARVRVS